MNKVRNLKLQMVVFILSLVLLSACGQTSLVTPTLTTVPTESPTSTATPLSIDTNTPEPTATEEIKQFNQCDADHWIDCYIPPEDLINGEYLDWVKANWHPNLPLPDPGKVVLHPMGGKGHLLDIIGNNM